MSRPEGCCGYPHFPNCTPRCGFYGQVLRRQEHKVTTGQSKRGSWAETCINTAIGYTINIVAQLLVLPIFNIHISVHDDFLMGMIFTVISIVRSFFVRRMFNQLYVRGIL